MPGAERNRKRIGAYGETAVRVHLERMGWEILAANFRCQFGEMDLIARAGLGNEETLVFVEVKTRRSARHGAPIEAVDTHKQSRLIAIAQAFLARQQAGGEEPACRFDIAEVFTDPDGLMRVQLHRAAFTAD
jgi:putative endonuclease